jgi:hypothetical protein
MDCAGTARSGKPPVPERRLSEILRVDYRPLFLHNSKHPRCRRRSRSLCTVHRGGSCRRRRSSRSMSQLHCLRRVSPPAAVQAAASVSCRTMTVLRSLSGWFNIMVLLQRQLSCCVLALQQSNFHSTGQDSSPTGSNYQLSKFQVALQVAKLPVQLARVKLPCDEASFLLSRISSRFPPARGMSLKKGCLM